MKMTLLAAVFALSFATAAQAEVNEAHYRITEVKVRELPDFNNRAFANTRGDVAIGSVGCSQSSSEKLFSGDQGTGFDLTTDVLNPLNTVELVVDKVINIGKKIWDIVQAGKPVSNLNSSVATALPMGAACWTDLESWQMPQSKVYEASFSNTFGVEVVKLSYRVLWLPGGQAKGVGAYIGYATMTPVDIKVSWGFNLNANVSVPTVFNMGSKEAPIAGMQMTMSYRISSPVTTIDQAQAFFVDGLGNFKKLE